MALAIQCSCFVKKQLSLIHPSVLNFPNKTRVTVRAADSSLPPSPSQSEEPKPVNGGTQEGPSVLTTPPKKSNIRPGVGFGSASSSVQTKDKKSKQKSRERAKIIRRSPVQKPTFLSQQGEAQSQEQGRNESAFLLTWLGLGSLILVEGIVLAASGFLPEEWDKFFVKYLYPSFTPTVVLFVVGTVGYGVSKYLQGEKRSS